MSNTAAISTVTAAFARRILAAANAAVPAANVRVGTPTADLSTDGNALVNLHLYRVEPDPVQRNTHLPNRSAAGTSLRPGQLALNLHFVLSFYGDHEAFEPELMLAQVMLALEHEPLLSKTTLDNATAEHDELSGSDLADANAKLRVQRELLSIDDFSKIWSIFYQVPYAISLIYEVSHVVIETDDPIPLPLPVGRPALWVAPLSTLRIDRIGGVDGALPVWGGLLRIAGTGLGQSGLALEVDGAELDLTTADISESEIALSCDLATFGVVPNSGVYKMRAIAPAQADQPDYLRPRSNTVPFAIHPAILPGNVNAPGDGVTSTGDMDITFIPPVASDQTVRLLLDARAPLPAAHVVLPGRPSQQGQPDESQLSFAFVDLPRGDYLARADVDGLISPVVIDAMTGQIDGPVVTI